MLEEKKPIKMHNFRGLREKIRAKKAPAGRRGQGSMKAIGL
jgi:hypothetical protein